jgi:glutamine amidotransferase
MQMIIVDYGLGNLYNLSNAFRYCGQEVRIGHDAQALLDADALILPGVGAFGDGMARLVGLGLDDAIRRFAHNGGPILGICLGMQLLMDWSEEFGFHKGLGLIKGGVKHLQRLEGFDLTAKVPHIGWNDIHLQQDSRFLEQILIRDMYFVHSYCAIPLNSLETLATVTYGNADFAAVIGKGKIVGCQFHPEKSSASGIQIVKNFIDVVQEEINGRS